MIELALKLAAAELKHALKSTRLDMALSKLPSTVLRIPRTGGSEPVTVCAIQYKIKLFSNAEELINDIDGYMKKACSSGAELVCFPELFGLLVAGLSPTLRAALKFLSVSGSGETNMSGMPDISTIMKHFSFLYDSYIHIMRFFARRYGVWLSCGSTFVYEEGKVFNRHTLLSPRGDIIGKGDKIHLTADEIALGVTAGEHMTVVSTPIGKIALAVCMDATYFETFKVAKALSADYIIMPIADMAEFDVYLAYRGSQMRVSEANLTAIKSALVSDRSFPVRFTGKAGVYFPLNSRFRSDEAPSYDKPEIVISSIDLTMLRALNPEPFCRKNAAFDKTYVSELLNYRRSKL